MRRNHRYSKISIPLRQPQRLLMTPGRRLQQKAVIRTSGFRSVIFARNEEMELVEYVSYNKRFKYKLCEEQNEFSTGRSL
jgi:hypothetical protein